MDPLRGFLLNGSVEIQSIIQIIIISHSISTSTTVALRLPVWSFSKCWLIVARSTILPDVGNNTGSLIIVLSDIRHNIRQILQVLRIL